MKGFMVAFAFVAAGVFGYVDGNRPVLGPRPADAMRRADTAGCPGGMPALCVVCASGDSCAPACSGGYVCWFNGGCGINQNCSS